MKSPTLATAAVSATLFSTAKAACTRDFLKALTSAYEEVQLAGDPSLLSSFLSPSLTYTENEVPVEIADGVMTEALIIDNIRSIHDPELCATFTEIIAASNDHPYVVGTRMVLSPVMDGDEEKPAADAEEDHAVTLIESIVTDEGDWAFNATGYLYWNSQESWEPIPEDQRDTREAIQAAGDSYFDRFNDTDVVVLFGEECARLEGGAYTGARNTTANTCDIGGLPNNIVVTDRRYVIDVEMGVVDILVGFPGLDRSIGQEPAPDSHMFRVEKGRIRYIHTVSSCVEDGCGMSFGGPMVKRGQRDALAGEVV